MTLSWPNHLLTLEEWDALPEAEGVWLELAEGLVVVSPTPLSLHQRAVMLGLPPGRTDFARAHCTHRGGGGGVRPSRTVRVRDIIMTRSRVVEHNPPRLSAADLRLAVEVLSDGTRRVDRVLKSSEYADAGIPQYWIIDLGRPNSLIAYVLGRRRLRALR